MSTWLCLYMCHHNLSLVLWARPRHRRSKIVKCSRLTKVANGKSHTTTSVSSGRKLFFFCVCVFLGHNELVLLASRKLELKTKKKCRKLWLEQKRHGAWRDDSVTFQGLLKGQSPAGMRAAMFYHLEAVVLRRQSWSLSFGKTRMDRIRNVNMRGTC